MQNFIKIGAIVLVFMAVIGTGVPAFAQTYGYAQNYTPITQNIYIPQNQMMFSPISMPSYTYPMQDYVYSQPSYSYPYDTYSNYGNGNGYGNYYPQQNQYSGYSYPQQNSYQYGNNGYQQPTTGYSYDRSQYYPYTTTYKDPNTYPRYWQSQPSYDPSYAWFSNYYQEYPSQVGTFTGNTDLFGTPLCNWPGGYQGYDCSSDPHQWVYDPYTGTWY